MKLTSAQKRFGILLGKNTIFCAAGIAVYNIGKLLAHYLGYAGRALTMTWVDISIWVIVFIVMRSLYQFKYHRNS